MGGEAYVSFKPNLIDEDGGFVNESTRVFLEAYMEPFLAIARLLGERDVFAREQEVPVG
jgi:chromate reductase